MNAGILPVALLFLAVGFSLSFASLRGALLGAGATAIMALVAAALSIGLHALEWVVVGLWISTISTIALIHLWERMPLPFAAAAGINAGVWAGALAATSSLRSQMLLTMPILLVVIPGYWLVQRGYGIALKVAGSWIVAVAILAIFVSLTPTPGYKPDHMQ